MRYVRLGNSGLKVSALSYGTMSFGGDADRDAAAALYARCRDAGITTFDCANVYNGGEAERILGDLCRHERDEVVITTKVYFPTGAGPNDRGLSRGHILRELDRSLERLGTDYVDIYFLHRWDEHAPLEETLRAAQDAVDSGKVRYLGISNFAAWQTMKALAIADAIGGDRVTCIQPMYNLVKRQAEVELFPMALAEGLGAMPYSPLAAGLLTGKYGRTKTPDAGRLQTNEMYKVRFGDAHFLDVADRLTAAAEARGVHPAALAVAWAAAHPAVTSPLIGAWNVRQLDGVLGSLDITLDDEAYAEIASFSSAPPLATDRSEEAQGYVFGGALTK